MSLTFILLDGLRTNCLGTASICRGKFEMLTLTLTESVELNKTSTTVGVPALHGPKSTGAFLRPPPTLNVNPLMA